MFNDIKKLDEMLTAEVQKELDERMDDLVADYVLLLSDTIDAKYPDGADPSQKSSAIVDFTTRFVRSVMNVSMMLGL